jgi:hypothetical protein
VTAWLLPTIDVVPAGGEIRNVGRFDRRAYHRAYYHAKRKGRVRQTYTPEQQARRRELARQRYQRDKDRLRGIARALYWKHRDRYAVASRERQRKLRRA